MKSGTVLDAPSVARPKKRPVARKPAPDKEAPVQRASAPPEPPESTLEHSFDVAGRGCLSLGIGVVTYKRAALAVETVAQIRRMTRSPFHLVIADDGSSPADVELLSSAGAVIGGTNHGVTWNKNRALFHLHAVCQCDVVILLEDDTRPTAPGWELPWIEAARRWGHANFAGHWFRDRVVGGEGSARKPFLSRDFSGQCTAFSREALDYVGYLDTRYRGFGIGHVDHTFRLGRAGFGAMRHRDYNTLFYLIDSALEIMPTDSARKDEDVLRNHALYQNLQHDGIHRNAWSTDAELAEFRKEQNSIRLERSLG